ncbi:ABC transporter ATP-binding protein [Nocardia mexicana]|uniref:Putative ABC transport system ATP-binding protein n=1 Tax=Nocardia mexicana TaxID=279262 RepID=A0A370GDA6_9NOCA|nr:ABC transporter ATP-binding protein [Nocardia mexicana]RDI41778.1 putative ABC transport system ATP-binding protein [Nocardia mexicana]
MTSRTAAARRAEIRLRGVNKTYGTGEAAVQALRDVDLDVAPGELVAVVGASGSGKTTLLNVVGGTEAADSGTIIVAGQDISGQRPERLGEFRRAHIGFVFQFFNLVPSLTARENVLAIIEMTGRGDRGRVDELLCAVDLADRADSFPGQMSGGQQQRVSLARALATDPDVVLADEPTGALDVATGRGVLRLLRATSRAGCSVVMVTHNEEAAVIADRVVRMRDGRVEFDVRNASPPDISTIRW